ncbi:glycosyltransferase [Sphingomonas sp. AP4-R1]|uniref:glycosyltransferase n=1 Tax=Sphingomonas sp. AP4-R1 TaxID=2735134 RepID=UPI0020A26AEA|nr:glycosyltransferase [Sphingomonas sp. AP4-R1]
MAGALMLLAVHPILTYPVSLALFVRKRPPVRLRAADAPRPSLAICMCAYREESVIAAKIERLIEIAEAYGPATIHVYTDAPSDDTAVIAQRYADRIELVIGTERAGKTYGMNLLVARSQSDLLMFTDANVESEADVAIELTAPLADPTVGCTTAQLIYSNSRESSTSRLGSFYWALEEWIKRIESDRIGLVGCDGAMFVMRRALHTPPPPHLIDDLYLSLQILVSGSRIVSVDHVEVFERSATGADEEKRRKQRIACQAINVHRAMWPRLRRMAALPLYAYVSHRPMKWLMPFFVAGAGLALLAAIGAVAGAAAVGGVVLLAAILLLIGEKAQIKPFSLFSSALLSLFGVAQGVIESVVFKKTYAIWDPAMSVRLDAQATDPDRPAA